MAGLPFSPQELIASERHLNQDRSETHFSPSKRVKESIHRIDTHSSLYGANLDNHPSETAENSPLKKALDSSLSFLRRVGRDILILSLVLIGINSVQTMYFSGKKVSPSVFTASWPSLSGAVKTIVDADRMTLVYMFAPWCEVCKFSSSNLNTLKDHFGVTSVALSYNHPQEIQEFIEAHNVQVPVVLGSGHLENQLDIGQFPTYFIVDPKGHILMAWSGYTTTLGLWARMLGVTTFLSFPRILTQT